MLQKKKLAKDIKIFLKKRKTKSENVIPNNRYIFRFFMKYARIFIIFSRISVLRTYKTYFRDFYFVVKI